MVADRTRLPRNFSTLVASGDLSRMIAVFDECDVNATQGKDGTNALGHRAAPPELMRWLVEHGADVNQRDTYGSTPLGDQIVAGNLAGVRTLIELGADTTDVNSLHRSALRHAAGNRRPEIVRLLLEQPTRKRLLSRRPVAPAQDVLQDALDACMNAYLPETVEIVRLLLDAGVKVDAHARERVTRIGDTFEQMRDAYDRESLPDADAALQELYRLTGVTPVEPARRHDGASPIEVPPGTLDEQVDALWTLLVPASGAASSAQGEAIRIVGRVADELQRNGGNNWDADHRAMLTNLRHILGSGTELADQDLADVDSIVGRLPRGEAETLCGSLNAHVVAWIGMNPAPISLPPPAYGR